MRMEHNFMQLGRSLAHALPEARAPRHWQSEVAQSTIALTAMPRLCKWVEEITALSMQLNSEPLFGDCLTQIMGNETPPTPAAEIERARSRSLHSVPVEEEERASKIKLPLPEARSLQPAASKRASLELDKRRCAPILSMSPQREAQVNRVLQRYACETKAVAKTKLRFKPPGIQSLPPRALASFVVAKEAKASLQNWQGAVARRAARLLTTNAVKSARTKSAGNEIAALNSAAGLENQWQMPLLGKTVRTQLLAQLAGKSIAETSRSETRGESRAAKPENSGVAPAGAAALLPQNTRREPKKKKSARFSDNPVPARRRARAHHLVNDEAPSQTVMQSDSLTAIPPFLATAIASPNFGLQVNQMPIAAPHIALAPLHERQDEQFTPEEDLSVLAQKIKRILDDEARRHGIEV